ncbi:MAG: choice-of-anchor B family protein [Bacteroidia bacterium]|nr:choice-of-anchor B family protein [Bacteroidia bacterium]MCZ2277192.1 choice-of-anchor B family protein [Bacteroidia bacterium]
MKKTLLVLLIITLSYLNSRAQTYDYQNMSLLSRFDDTTYVANNWVGSKYSGCWGWYNPVDQREYAIIGGSNKTYIVEITNPSNPVLRASIPGLQINCVWREYKTYQNYLYMVSDDAEPNGMQIADLSYLPDSVHLVHNGSSLISRSHTIWVDGDKLYCGSVRGAAIGNTPGNNFASMAVFSLANPANPVLLRKLNSDYPTIGHVHDMFVRNDTCFASCGNDGLYVFKFNSNHTFTQLGSLTTYPFAGYNHSTAWAPNAQVMVMTDEVPTALPAKVLDVSDVSNITVSATFNSSAGATPHNLFLLGNDYVVCANYQDGIQIYNLSDPANPVRTGYFDTHYQTPINGTSQGYVGCWGAYPWLPSGNIIAADMQNGLYILNASAALGITNNPEAQLTLYAYYNLISLSIDISLSLKSDETLELAVYNTIGELLSIRTEKITSGHNRIISIPAEGWPQGMYIIQAKIQSASKTVKLVKP